MRRARVLHGEGFGEELDPLVQDPVSGDDVGGVPREEQALHGGVQGPEPLRQIPAVHPGEDHVRHQQVDGAGGLRRQGQGLLGVPGGQHLVPPGPGGSGAPAPGSGVRPPPGEGSVPVPGGGPRLLEAPRALRGPPKRGRKIRKVLPMPRSLWSWRNPPFCTTMPSTVGSPSPVPRSSLVEKKGSKACSRVASSMPFPSSCTRSRNVVPAPSLRGRFVQGHVAGLHPDPAGSLDGLPGVGGEVRQGSAPPGRGPSSRATGPPRGSSPASPPPPPCAATGGAGGWTVSFRSRTRGAAVCRRAKARSCPVSSAECSAALRISSRSSRSGSSGDRFLMASSQVPRIT